MFIGDVTKKSDIYNIIWEAIELLTTVRNIASPTIPHKYGEMEADSLYINVYKYDARMNKELMPDNENFVCFVDYNQSGTTNLKDGGLPALIWQKLYHEKSRTLLIAWREGKYIIHRVKKVGVNDSCPCGSGNKFKKCCRGKGLYD